MGQVARNIELYREPATDLVPVAEHRREGRTRMVYRLVRVEIEGDEGLARCRNISDNGMKLELTMPVAVGSTIRAAFSPSFVCIGRVVWARGLECGVVFDCTIDSPAMLRDSASETEAERLRGLRIKRSVPARISFDGATHMAMSTELSPYGMRLRHRGGFRPGLHVTVMLGGTRERVGVVRWSEDEYADLILLEPFSVAELGSVGALAAA